MTESVKDEDEIKFYNIETSLSIIPATVKTPPMMAQSPVAKWPNDFSFSLYFTMTGANS